MANPAKRTEAFRVSNISAPPASFGFSNDAPTSADLCRALLFLQDYAYAVRMLRLCRQDKQEREGLAADCRHAPDHAAVYYGEVGGDEAHWLARMRAVRDFIDAFPDRDGKLLLYYHYIRGLTVERTAEELDISRRSAFRLKKRTLQEVARLLSAQNLPEGA